MALLFRNKPEDMGLQPDGDSLPRIGEPQSGGPRPARTELDFTTGEAIRSPTFRWLLLGESFRSFLLGSIVLYEIPHLLKLGFSEEAAASILGLMILSSIPGRIVFGVLGDFVSKRMLLIVAMLMQGLGVLIFAYAADIAHVYAFLLFYGLAYGGAIPLLMAYRGELFGRKRFATISGIMAPFRTIGSVAGPVFAGYAYDVTGSYRFAFLVFTLLAALSAASFYMIKSERI
jgi:MFS family permease